MSFWLIAAALAAIVALTLLLALMRGRGEGAPAAAYDLQVYRDQLKEVEKDLARGVLTPEDAERTKLEISRRVLEADRAAHTEHGATPAPKGLSIAVAVLVGAIMLGGSLVLYDRIGAPGYPDLSIKARKIAADEAHANRPHQGDAEEQVAAIPGQKEPDPAFVDLVAKLHEVVAQHPNDTRGLTLLARNEAALGNFKEAYIAQSKLIGLKKDATTADDFAAMADMMVLAAGGYVSPEAEGAIKQALTLDKSNGTARYYLGLMYAQTGRPDIAFNVWRGLLEDSKTDDPWVQPIRGGIEELAMRAGVEYTLPAAAAPLAGPSAEDVQNAAQMTPEERQDMVRGMVAQLSERLDTEGGSAAEWARLIGAYGVLGEADKAADAKAHAQEIFADSPDDLAVINGAGQGGAPAAPALRGPSAEDMQNAAQLSPEERQQMIATMVENLNDRLANEGGTSAEWAQLIGALGTLGQKDRARAVWNEAQTVFAQRPADLEQVRAAAQSAGLLN